jgi:anti-sigma factor RsiW
MTDLSPITDQMLHDLLDGRLAARERERVTAAVVGSRSLAARMTVLRRQRDAIKSIGREILDEPVPERLRRVLTRCSQKRPVQRRPAQLLGVLGVSTLFLS